MLIKSQKCNFVNHFRRKCYNFISFLKADQFLCFLLFFFPAFRQPCRHAVQNGKNARHQR